MIPAIKTLVLIVIPLVTLVQSTTLKSPKVYNALITTDQNLIPSRAYPVVQPTIHDAGFGYSAFGLGHHHHNAFGLYDPYAGPYHHGGFIGGPIPGGFQARNQYSFFSSQQGKSASSAAAAAVASESAGASASSVTSDQAIISGNDAQLDAGSVANTNLLKENPPIPLNEFGLPPNLIPLSTPQDFNRQGNPVNLQPYPYNSYPLIYDSFGGGYNGGYNGNPYLPPFSYYPSAFGGPGILGGAPGALAPGAAGPGGPGGPGDVGGAVDGADGDAGVAGADGDVGGSDGDLDGGQDGDIDGGAGGDGGSAGGAGGASGGGDDGGSTISEKQTNDGVSALASSSTSGGSSGGSGGSFGSSSTSGGDGGGSSSSSSSSTSSFRATSRRTSVRGSNIRSALRADPQISTQS